MTATIPTMSAALDDLVTDGIRDRMTPVFRELLDELTGAMAISRDFTTHPGTYSDGRYSAFRAAQQAVIGAAEQAGIDLGDDE